MFVAVDAGELAAAAAAAAAAVATARRHISADD